MLAVAGNNFAQLWTISSHASYCTFNNFSNNINSICFTADGEKLCFASDSEYLNIVNVYSGETNVLETQSPTINVVKCSSDGQFLATGSKTGTITLFAKHGEKPLSFRQHKFAITSMSFTSDSSALICGDKRGIMSIGSFKPSKLPNWSSKIGTIRDISIANNSSLMGVAAGEQLAFYDLNQMKIFKSLNIGACRQIKFSPFSNSLIAIATLSGDLFFFDPSSNTIVNQAYFGNEITAMDFRFDARTLSISVKEQGLKLIDIRHLDKEIQSLDLYQDNSININSIAFQPCIVQKPLFSGYEQISVKNIKGKRHIKVEKPEVEKGEVEKTEKTEKSTIDDDFEDRYSHLDSILNSDFEYNSHSQENIDIDSLEPSQIQISLAKTAQEINKPIKKVITIEQNSFQSAYTDSFESSKSTPGKTKSENRSLNSHIKEIFDEKMADFSDEFHEHANKMHIDVIQKLNELNELISSFNIK